MEICRGFVGDLLGQMSEVFRTKARGNQDFFYGEGLRRILEGFVLVYGVEDAPGELGDNGVAESSNSVHPVGYPIIHSTNRGLIRPVIPLRKNSPANPSLSACDAGSVAFFASFAVGVGSSIRLSTVSRLLCLSAFLLS